MHSPFFLTFLFIYSGHSGRIIFEIAVPLSFDLIPVCLRESGTVVNFMIIVTLVVGESATVNNSSKSWSVGSLLS